MNSKRFRLWDLPTRLCHWLLVLAVAAAIVSGNIGGNFIEWHGKLGLAIIGLVSFRLVWGLLGSTYARFGQFLPGPAKIRAYLKGEWHGAGHNPLGAFSVLALLGLLVLQGTTGLFANDDIAFTGPLYSLVSESLSQRLTGLHHLGADLLMILVGLHVAAIVFYVRVKKDNLVLPMLTGWKEGKAGESATGGGPLALLVALAVAAAVVYAASGACLPPLPPPAAPPAVETPSW